MDLSKLPLTHQATISPEHLDVMGHMNVRWYTALFDEATFTFFNLFGLDADYLQNTHAGSFALEQHTHYLAEVRLGETVKIYSRALDRSIKRLHYMHFMLKADGKLAATTELVSSHADLLARRTTPLPESLASAYDQLLAQHQELDWAAPLCGVIKA